MAGLTRFVSNRLEILAGSLAECIGDPWPDPLTAETVVVQSAGMARWLAMELARRHGICANVRFPFPNAFLNEVFRTVLPDPFPAPACDPAALQWKIMKTLPHCLDDPAFAPIRRYIEDDAQDVKRYQLSGRIADLFDQYLVFRPDMMIAWESGRSGVNDEAWQSELWRRLRRDESHSHPALLRERFLERMRHPLPAETRVPGRIALFGISWLPHFHLEAFHALSAHRDIRLFLLNPCREFWSEIRSNRESDRTVEKFRAATGQITVSAEDLFLETGNSLLASLGAQGRDLLRWLADLPGEEREIFEDPGEETLLRAVQSDILNLRERVLETDAEESPVDPMDRSIQIHSCHSPMREVEVLHDQILALFAEDPDLLPADVLVMAPDMDRYAPLIQAVFDAPPSPSGDRSGAPRIPFAIAGRTMTGESPVANLFLGLLELAESRLGVLPVLALLGRRLQPGKDSICPTGIWSRSGGGSATPGSAGAWTAGTAAGSDSRAIRKTPGWRAWNGSFWAMPCRGGKSGCSSTSCPTTPSKASKRRRSADWRSFSTGFSAG